MAIAAAAGGSYLAVQNFAGTTPFYQRSYMYFTAAPGTAIPVSEMATTGDASTVDVLINANLTVTLNATGVGQGTSSEVLTVGKWWRIEMKADSVAAGNDTLEARVYDGDSLTPFLTLGPYSLAWTALATIVNFRIGNPGGNSWGFNVADWALNDSTGAAQNSWAGPGAIYTLRPVGDGTAGTAEANWTKPGGGTTGKATSVDNTPPVFAADSTSAADGESFLRNVTAASSDVTLACTDYTTANVPLAATVAAVQPVAVIGAGGATAQTGTLGMPSNPTVAQANVAYPTAAASATPSSWTLVTGTVSHAPTVTRGTQPQIRLNRPVTNAQACLVDALGITVDATPAVATSPANLARPGAFDPQLIAKAWF